MALADLHDAYAAMVNTLGRIDPQTLAPTEAFSRGR